MINKLAPYSAQWGFVDTALAFLLKGFLSEGLEQLLWHITAIEAAIGPGEGGTVRLRSRVARIVGQTESAKRRTNKAFEKLYRVRNELIHGNAALKNRDVVFGHLSQARDFARMVVLWLLNYLDHVVDYFSGKRTIPRRDELLGILDMDTEFLDRNPDLARRLPPTFPCVPGWIAEAGDTDD